MLGKELKEKYLKPEVMEDVGVIAIGKDFWYHVHDDEEIPKEYEPTARKGKEEFTIALHPRI